MIIDGRKIAEEIKEFLKQEISKTDKKLKLAIVQAGDDPVSKKFIERKVKFAEEIGVKTKVYNLPADISTNKLRQNMAGISHIKENSGVILQLPLPKQINTQYVLNGIVLKKDVDVLSSRAFGDFSTDRSKILPPVVGATKIILDKVGVDLNGKHAVVIGRGILVGKPVAIWLINRGAAVSVLNSATSDITKFTKEADIIISGVGKPDLITPEIVKEGVIIIDAGTSYWKSSFHLETGFPSTSIVGDVAPEVAEKASIFTPVPGGIGPITVAMIFKNLLLLNK
ncbi:bifunctional 5,10-methylenetetrahydrofolate dehydrogenase/5,10-methenyltetrahydrofolate cyclohydrolase [Candidatus Parcubacteria bacterium]|nr:bifunctional 5,10-methylenetetrahydrofolate dehydrogenase/5,10-methenyltetrahydrofolate cyclohydrolase [Patescibacteria group bacterium]MBU4477097.1 bifunctional 5,10-methylenetetrahydrofolate dehydrogenase/5,10-methenyltetrahydrofolate cyclohydrolase [Patescibacteria group bacterium]MCG2698974.1 bifunctional 5,10-methylenetetrahydrofolate dehydrogenase/5,10-methenyltetrahydrofolate cyclohydrolase [Candidatus Parcubacteria bacterium]